MHDIQVGDRFYLNTTTVRKGLSLPDYLVITKFIPVGEDAKAYIQAKYENHSVDTRERLFSGSIVGYSNLNKDVTDPMWIFLQ